MVNWEKRVFPVLPKSDIAKLLDAIDRTKVKGKRDYAIMLLGTVLGLRACDIVTLKLTDIDWLHGEIRIMQSKTSNPVILPLTQDVGEALKDYILNARPDTADSEIFLRINAPHTRLAAAVTVGEIYRDCCIAAGLPASKRFHNLRRALGTSMVANGVLSINFSDGDWTGKIIGLVVGWFICLIPFITAIIGCVKQSQLPKSIGNDAVIFASQQAPNFNDQYEPPYQQDNYQQPPNDDFNQQ